MRTPPIEIDVNSSVRRAWVDVRRIREAAAAAAQAEGFESGSLSIAVVGRAAMARLHARHSGDPTPTDVLTFDLGTDGGARRLDGEIIVCADVALAAAPGRGTVADRRRARVDSPRAALAELVLYTVHGVLHLAGYDDHDPAAFRRMHAREDEILTSLGWGAVFATPSAPAASPRTRR